MTQTPRGAAIAKNPIAQTVIAEAPPAAAVATHCRFVPAVIRKRRTSRNPRFRWRPAARAASGALSERVASMARSLANPEGEARVV
jgi:hypothetical protein